MGPWHLGTEHEQSANRGMIGNRVAFMSWVECSNWRNFDDGFVVERQPIRTYATEANDQASKCVH